MKRTALALAVALLAPTARAGEEDFVPFVIPHGSQEGSLIRFSHSPIPADKRVIARDGHFYVGDKRLRVWGVNTCFGANFPTHRDAERMAARMADFGINSVRFHHMDSAHFPRGIWDKADPWKLSAEALDRLDYFIDQLARNGIYTNLNLHVSRTHSRYLKLPDRDRLRNYDKIVDIFTPELIDAQKRYARMLLTHVNKYRKLRYADDPAVAFVEINNEDSLFMWGAERTLTSLPPYYAKILQGKFAAWLKSRYGGTDKLRAAWAKGGEKLGDNVLADVKIERGGGKKGWFVGNHGGCQARAVNSDAGVRIEIAKANSTNWHIQFIHGRLSVRAGRYYTVTFRARADRARRIDFNVGQNHAPWGMLGLVRGAELTNKWRSVRAGFIASADDDKARVCFQLGGSDVAVELADVQLRPGGREGLREGESTEAASVALFADSETDARMIDRWRFLTETEKAYFDEMYAYVKKDLGCKALVTGTIVFGPCGLYAQSGMDYIDAHAYWQHPRFPGRPWDPANWTVEQKAMVDSPTESTLFRLVAQRLAGKPYTVSEYNHPAPNDYQAECVPMIASFAAAQDWDGVWLFTYSHRTGDVEREHFTNFFDIDANPAKWGFVPAGTVIFRDGGVGPLANGQVVAICDPEDRLTGLAALHRAHGRDMLAALGAASKITGRDVLRRRIFCTLSGDRVRPRVVEKGPNDSTGITWRVLSGRGHYNSGDSGASVLIYRPDDSLDYSDPNAKATSPWRRGVITQTPLDGLSAARTKKLLVTACVRCENTGMKFSKDRRTVGRNWGRGPVRIEPASDVDLLLPPGQWRCQALGPDGRPTAEVKLTLTWPRPTLRLDPKHKTMWYLLTRE